MCIPTSLARRDAHPHFCSYKQRHSSWSFASIFSLSLSLLYWLGRHTREFCSFWTHNGTWVMGFGVGTLLRYTHPSRLLYCRCKAGADFRYGRASSWRGLGEDWEEADHASMCGRADNYLAGWVAPGYVASPCPLGGTVKCTHMDEWREERLDRSHAIPSLYSGCDSMFIHYPVHTHTHPHSCAVGGHGRSSNSNRHCT